MVLDFFVRAKIVLLLLGVWRISDAGQYQPPHIIVIMADDLGWNDVGFHGSNQIPTPNIDALAYNGIILNRHYVLPSCSPTRAAFFTGRYPIRMGMQGDGIRGGEPRGIPLDVQILPEYLRSLGYSTKLIGKWHVGYHTQYHTPLHRGFDHFFGFFNSYVTYFQYMYSVGNMSGYDMHRGDHPAYGYEHEYATDLFTGEALKIIAQHDPQRPLYLQISHLAVHAPLEVPIEDINDYEFNHITERNRRKYAAMVKRLDDSVGRVFAALGDRGMLRDSIVLFLSDNGAASVGKFRNYGSNYPLRGMKYTLYEGGVRGVATLWSPRLHTMARVSDQLVHVSDWLPTLYAAAGGNVRDLGDIDGVNQWNALSNGYPNARESIILNIDEIRKTEGAIIGHHKLVRGSHDKGFYDGYQGESGRGQGIPQYNDSKVMRSAVSSTIITHLGGPITQPSAMFNLRQNATVECHSYSSKFIRRNFSTCNETECLFNIFADPCETTNIAKDSSRFVKQLDQMLEKYGNVVRKQVRLLIDWRADPRRTNNTWEPWLSHDTTIDVPRAAATAAVCAHIGMVLLIFGLRVFI